MNVAVSSPERRHTWLLVRDFSRGDVVFWETTNNRQYRVLYAFFSFFVCWWVDGRYAYEH